MRRKRKANISKDPHLFIVTNLTRDEFDKGELNFTLGDGGIYGGFVNKPLVDGAVYAVRVGYAKCMMRVSLNCWR